MMLQIFINAKVQKAGCKGHLHSSYVQLTMPEIVMHACIHTGEVNQLNAFRQVMLKICMYVHT
jgi:hypothetical protein